MTQSAYEKLVYRLEGTSKADPAAFRVRVFLLACLFPLVFWVVPVLAAYLFWEFSELNGGALALGLALSLLSVALLQSALLRYCQLQLAPRDGKSFRRRDLPALFDLADRIAGKLKGPGLDRLVISTRGDAEIRYCRHDGLLGAKQRVLVVGLPYLLAMPMREVTALLVHELAHLALTHGFLGRWIYRQRLGLSRIHAWLSLRAAPHLLGRLALAFCRMLLIHYRAYTFVLIRQLEHEADAAALTLAGEDAHAGRLIRQNLFTRWLDKVYWPKFLAQADDLDVPEQLPFAAMQQALPGVHEDWARLDALLAAMREDATLDDPHPCLQERLDVLERKPSLPAPPQQSAAEALFGSGLDALVADLDQLWWQGYRPDWQAQFRRRERDRQRADELASQPAEELSSDALFELAQLRYRLGERKPALALLRLLLERRDAPKAQACLLRGKIMLRAGDRRGLEALLEAVRTDGALASDCLRTGRDYLRRHPSVISAGQWENAVQMACSA